jgi:polyphenol oxidase
MFIHKAPRFQIYIGDSADQTYQSEYLSLSHAQAVAAYAPFAHVKQLMQLDGLFFLKQIHGVLGTIITCHEQDLLPFTQEGDFLITHVPHTGIGLMTADCLPLVLYDQHNHAAGIIHAGWKGAVQSIAIKALEAMHNTYGTEPSQVHAFVGPSAKICCYQVSDDFVNHLDAFVYGNQLLQKRDNGLFFDLSALNCLQLESYGVLRENISLEYNQCTICNSQFYSHRRQGSQAGRQMTIIALK